MTAAEATPRVPRWPVLLIALPAFVAIWSGWVGLGRLTGFGPVVLLPGIADQWVIDSAITLPIGVESYAAYAMFVWLAPVSVRVSAEARQFACWSSIGALVLGMAGQVAYHLMTAAGMTVAPWQITAFVACLPVAVLGCAAALVHLTHRTNASGSTANTAADLGEAEVTEATINSELIVAERLVPDHEFLDDHGVSRLWDTAPLAAVTAPAPAPKAPRARATRFSAFLADPPAQAIELARKHGKDVLRREVLKDCGIEITEYEAVELRRAHRPNGHLVETS
jgi:hypothetical protein